MNPPQTGTCPASNFQVFIGAGAFQERHRRWTKGHQGRLCLFSLAKRARPELANKNSHAGQSRIQQAAVTEVTGQRRSVGGDACAAQRLFFAVGRSEHPVVAVPRHKCDSLVRIAFSGPVSGASRATRSPGRNRAARPACPAPSLSRRWPNGPLTVQSRSDDRRNCLSCSRGTRLVTRST